MDTAPQSFNDLVALLSLPESVLQMLSAYPYAFVFVGLLLGGETVLLPALYLAVIGVLNGWLVMGIMIASTVISDGFWYSIGRGLAPHFIERFASEKRALQLQKISHVITGKELIILFYSKFIYGTRIATQMLCGARKINFYRYFAVNTCAVVALGAVYYLTVRSSFVIVNYFSSFHYRLVVVFVLIVAVSAIIHVLVSRLVKRKWYQ
ncbi:MAG: VTT domain-containing protein [bacterium]|nr:VTT domain-containing protein [bacterium]